MGARQMRGMKVVMGCAVAGAAMWGMTGAARGGTDYWDGTGTSWATAADWSTNQNATTPNPGAAPGSGDGVIFNISTVNTAQTVTLDGNQATNGINFSSTGSVTINTGAGTNTLSVGNTGMVVVSGAGAVTINTAVTETGVETWQNDSTNLFLLTGNVAINANGLSIFGPGNITLSGGLTGGGIVKSGTGTLTVGGGATNTVALAIGQGTVVLNKPSSATVHATGQVTISAGVLRLSGVGGDQILNSGTVSMSGGVFDFDGQNEGFDVLTGTGGLITNLEDGSASTMTVGMNNSDSTFSGTITDETGTIGVTKAGTGTLTLSGANTYTGNTTVTGGVLKLAAANVLQPGTIVAINGGTLQSGLFDQTTALMYVGGTQLAPGSAGVLNIAGATMTVTNILTVWSGTGQVNLTAGTLVVADLNTNGNPSGFNWTHGTLHITNSFSIEPNQGLGSPVTISASKTLMVDGNETSADGGDVVINQTGGTHTVEFGLFLGDTHTTTYNFSGGTLSAAGTGDDFSAWGGMGTGVFIQTGGTATMGDIHLGENLSGVGSVTLSDTTGSGTFTANEMDVGGNATTARGQGTVTITQGTMTVSTLNIWSPTGNVTLSGGILNVGTLNDGGNYARFVWTGGTLHFTGSMSVSASGPLGGAVTLGTGMLLTTLSGLTNGGSITLTGGAVGGGGQIVNDGLLSGTGTVQGIGGFVNNAEVMVTGGSLTLSNAGALSNVGNIDLSAGGQLVLNSGNLTNSGTINLNSSVVSGTATLVNAGGTVMGRGLILSAFTNASGILEVPAGTTTVALAFTNGGSIVLSDGTANLTGGAVTNTGTIQGLGNVNSVVTNTGTIEAVGGTLAFAKAVTSGAAGLIRVDSGSKVLISVGLATNGGTISLVGGTFDNGGDVMNNTGQITGYGVLSSGGLTNHGNVTLTGGTTTVNGAVTNSSANFNVKFNPVIFTGNVTNSAGATITVTQATVAFGAAFINNGTYTSDPSTTTFQSDVTNDGAMSGGVGDAFHFTGGTFSNDGSFVNGGSLSAGQNVNNTGSFVQTGSQVWAAGSVFTNEGGTAVFGSNAGASGSANLKVVVTGGIVTFAATQRLAGLEVDGGTVDVGRSDLIVEGGSAAGIRAEVGTGIVSSELLSGEEIVVVDNSLAGLTVVGGQVVDAGSVLVVPTFEGDANLDGVVDIQDLQAVANHWQGGVNNWTLGDFDGNGVVDIRDLQMVANHWQAGVGSGGSGQGFSEALALVGHVNNVPEAGTLGVMGMGGLVLMRRRKGEGR